MINCKHFDTSTKEGKKAQKILLPILKAIKDTLVFENIEVWCINRYSYRATLFDNKITFEIFFPKATSEEHTLAINKIIEAFPNIVHVQNGLQYFNQIRFGYDTLVEMEYIQDFSVYGIDMRFEIFEMRI